MTTILLLTICVSSLVTVRFIVLTKHWVTSAMVEDDVLVYDSLYNRKEEISKVTYGSSWQQSTRKQQWTGSCKYYYWQYICELAVDPHNHRLQLTQEPTNAGDLSQW